MCLRNWLGHRRALLHLESVGEQALADFRSDTPDPTVTRSIYCPEIHPFDATHPIGQYLCDSDQR